MPTETSLKRDRQVRDGGYGWVIVGSHFLFYFLCTGSIKSFGVFLPLMATDMNTTPALLGLACGLCNGLIFLLNPVWSVIFVPNRRILLVASLLVFVTMGATSFCHQPMLIPFLFSITGIGYSIFAYWLVVTMHSYFSERFSIAYSIGSSGQDLGMILLPVVSDRLSSIYGWRGAFLLLAALNFHLSISAILCRHPDDPGVCGPCCIPGSRDGKRQKNDHQPDGQSPSYSQEPCSCCNEKGNGERSCAIIGRTEAEAERQMDFSGSVDDLGILGVLVEERREYSESYTVNIGSAREGDIDRTFHNDDDENAQLIFNESDIKTPEWGGKRHTSKAKTKSKIEAFAEHLRPFRIIFSSFSVVIPIFFSYFLIGIGKTGVLIFLVPAAVDKGFSLSKAVNLSLVFGFGDFVGRFLIGFFLVKTKINPIKASLILTVVCGVTFSSYPFAGWFPVLCVNAFVNGMCLGALVATMVSTLNDVLPKDLFKYAYALLCMSFGSGAPLGGLLAGKFEDWTSSYSLAFVFFGALLFINVLLLIAALCLQAKSNQSEERRRLC